MNILARLTLVWDWKFFAVLPALNANMHSHSVEVEWLFLGVYLDLGGPSDDDFVLDDEEPVWW